MPQQTIKQKLHSWLSYRMLCCCTYIGLAAEQLAQVCVQLFITSGIVILIAIATTLEVTIFPAFHYR